MVARTMTDYGEVLEAREALWRLFHEPQWIDGETWKRLVKRRKEELIRVESEYESRLGRSPAS